MPKIETILKNKVNTILNNEEISFTEDSFIYRAFLAHLNDLVTGDAMYKVKPVEFNRSDLSRANEVVAKLVESLESEFAIEISKEEQFLMLVYAQTLLEADQKQKLPTVALVFDDATNLLSIKAIIKHEFGNSLALKMFSHREYKLTDHQSEEKIYITDCNDIKGNNVITFNGDEYGMEIVVSQLRKLVRQAG